MSASRARRPELRTATVCALLFGGTLLLFSRATDAGFLNYDDVGYITENARVQGGLSWDGVRWAFTAPTDYWHPLTWLSHMLDWQLYGPSAAGHHLTSVLWHALNAVLVFLVFRQLAGGFWRSAFAAALFAWHPLRVESVAWISERKDVMSGCFFLLTLLAYARYGSLRAAGRRAWPAYLLTLAAFAAGLMSKPMLVTLPVVLLLLDFWPLARGTSAVAWRRLVIEKLPFFAMSAAAGVATVLMQRGSGAFVLDLPLGARLGNAAVSYARYLGKFVWPADLIVCYSHPGYWPATLVLAAGALGLGLTALAWAQRRERPWIAVGWGWYGVILLPVCGVIQVGFQAMADRYTYLALLGIELALIRGIPAWPTRAGRWITAGGAAVLLAACAALTWTQEGVWRDSVSLFGHAVEVSPESDVAENFLSSAMVAAGRYEEAEVHANRALKLNPRNDRALVVLGNLRERQGNVAAAIALYRSALALRPDNPPVQCELGLFELGRGHTASARVLILPAIMADRALLERSVKLGRDMLGAGDAKSALFLFELVLTAAPDHAEAEAGAGYALLAEHDAAAAIIHLRAAAARAPRIASVQLALAVCADQLGRPDEAAAALALAAEGAHANATILARVADLLAQRRDFTGATRLYRRVVELAPADSGAHIALGFLLLQAGDRNSALAEWRRALELNPNLPGLRDRLEQEEKQMSESR